MKIPFDGFDRILINEYQAVSERKAHEMGIAPVVGFRRNDGWCLGAPAELEDVAYRLYALQWTHVIRRPQTEWMECDE